VKLDSLACFIVVNYWEKEIVNSPLFCILYKYSGVLRQENMNIVLKCLSIRLLFSWNSEKEVIRQ
jgi:hypothetical protein